jgi:hypothetical protein
VFSIAEHLFDSGVRSPYRSYNLLEPVRSEYIKMMAGTVRYEINRRLDPIGDYYKTTDWQNWQKCWRDARAIHVFLLRCEGHPYHRCAERLGVSTMRARQLHGNAIRRLARAWRHVLPLVEESRDAAGLVTSKERREPEQSLHQ